MKEDCIPMQHLLKRLKPTIDALTEHGKDKKGLKLKVTKLFHNSVLIKDHFVCYIWLKSIFLPKNHSTMVVSLLTWIWVFTESELQSDIGHKMVFSKGRVDSQIRELENRCLVPRFHNMKNQCWAVVWAGLWKNGVEQLLRHVFFTFSVSKRMLNFFWKH